MTGHRSTPFSAADLRDGIAVALRDCTPKAGDSDDRRLREEHWRLATDMGWLGALVPEAQGGLALGHAFVADLCEEAGRALFCGPLIETAVLLPALAHECAALAPLLDGVLAGTVRLAVAEAEAEAGPVLAQHSAGSTHVAILELGADGLSATLTPSDAFRIEALQPLDPRSTMARMELVEPDAVVQVPLSQEAAARVLHSLHVALAADLLGTGEAALKLTVRYVQDRRQFGQPIGQFQAVKHRLSDVHTTLGAARLAIAGAVRDDAGVGDAAIARVLAADAALEASRAAIQLHGGLGFSWEADLHLYLKRALRLNAYAGGTRMLREAAGERIIADSLADAA